jgi:hypothetical protein
VEVANVRTLKLQVHDADPGYVAMKLGKGDNGAALHLLGRHECTGEL